MKSFSDVYNEYFALSKYDLAKKMFEAGQQSKQAEVDELRFQRDVLSNKVDELRKRINDAIYDLQHIESAMWEEQVEHVLMILKGDQS